MGSRFRYYRYHRYHMSIMSGPRLSLWKQRSFGKRSGDAEIKVTLLGRRDGTTCPKWVAAWLHRCRCQPDTVSGWRLVWLVWDPMPLKDMLAFLRPLDENLQTNKAECESHPFFWSHVPLSHVGRLAIWSALRCGKSVTRTGSHSLQAYERWACRGKTFWIISFDFGLYLDFFRWGCWCQNPIVLGRRAIETWFCMASVLLGAMLVSPKTMHRAEGRQSHSTRAEEASQSHNLSDGSSEDLRRTGASPAAVFDKVRSCFHRRLPWFGWPAGGRNQQNTWADSEQTWALQHVTHSEVICGLLSIPVLDNSAESNDVDWCSGFKLLILLGSRCGWQRCCLKRCLWDWLRSQPWRFSVRSGGWDLTKDRVYRWWALFKTRKLNLPVHGLSRTDMYILRTDMYIVYIYK